MPHKNQPCANSDSCPGFVPSDQRELTRAFRKLIGFGPILGMMGTGIAAIFGAAWFLNTNWSDVKQDVKAQGQTIQIHENLIRNQGQEIQNINVHFARLEQMLQDIQNGRRTSLSDLPQASVYPAGASGDK